MDMVTCIDYSKQLTFNISVLGLSICQDLKAKAIGILFWIQSVQRL